MFEKNSILLGHADSNWFSCMHVKLTKALAVFHYALDFMFSKCAQKANLLYLYTKAISS